MDFSKLGLKNIFGITIPGAFLVMVGALSYCIISILLNGSSPGIEWFKGSQLVSLFVFFILSYIAGNILRLNSADNVDNKSSAYLMKQYNTSSRRKSKSYTKKMIEIRDAVLQSGEHPDASPEFDDWVWRYENFPYHTWELRKFQHYHPEEMKAFFEKYRPSMQYGAGSNKEFFNYCKMVVNNATKVKGQKLTEEIDMAEALVRFFAGIYYSFKWSLFAIGFLLAAQIIAILVQPFDKALEAIKAALPFSLFLMLTIVVFWVSMNMIKKRFRRLRLKEVDAVFEAFYLVNAEKTQRETAKIDSLSKLDNFEIRKALIKEAIEKSKAIDSRSRAVLLESLVTLMKEKSKDIPVLSSIYFAGGFVDHPYFLENDKVSIGIAVLPEDAEKAGKRKLHPHQTEVVFVLSGKILLCHHKGNKTKISKLAEGDVFVIEKGLCHWIESVDNMDAVYLFVKTSPLKEPRGVDCKDV